MGVEVVTGAYLVVNTAVYMSLVDPSILGLVTRFLWLHEDRERQPIDRAAIVPGKVV